MAMLSAKDVAAQIGTDPKTFRRFVRAHVKNIGGAVGVDTPGRGGRYAFDADEIGAIADAFNAWRTSANAMHISFAVSDDDDA